MTQNIRNLEEINQQMKEDMKALIDKGDLKNVLGLHSGESFLPPRPFLKIDPQDNTRLMPIASSQGKSVLKEIIAIAAKNIDKAALGICETAKNIAFDWAVIDDPIKEQSFKKTPHEFSAELIANYQKMVESIEGKEGASFSQRKFWEGQYMQSPAQQTNSAFGFTDIIKIEVSQADYDKLYKVAIEGHDRIQLFFDCLVIDDVPIFIDDELDGVCKIYRFKDLKNKEQEIINLAFYPENIVHRNPEPIKYIGGV